MHAPARLRVSHLLAAAAMSGALLQPGPGGAASTHPVTVGGSGTPQSPYVYQGVPASVIAGDTVTWLNPTTANHTVTPTLTPDAGFRSHDLNGQGSYHEYRFTVPGGYAFHCQNHPDTMHATLTVNPAPSPTPSPPPAALPAPRPAPTAPPTARAAAISPTAAPPAPSRSATPAPRPAATPPPVAVAETPSSDAETETGTATTSGSILPTAPQPPLTAAPAAADHGGPSLPVVLGLLALMVALTAGAVALRRRG
ncbi:MAG TPA: plastocyanin/azurin family copper-binding protein [Candidatus Dormibacteraeota bacterium]|nr:plastocyanin/azurin family copper-binding protein [Candidatus Dormibacteraeota bacterium]